MLGRNLYYTVLSIMGIGVTLMLMLIAVAIIDAVTGPRPPELKTDRMLVNSSILIKNDGTSRQTSPGYHFASNTVDKLTLPEVSSYVSYWGYNRVLAGTKSSWGNLILTDAGYWQIMDYIFLSGFPFSTDDVNSGARVAVINRKTAEALYGNTDVEGKTIRVRNQNYRISGVVENISRYREVAMGDVFIPLTSEEKISGNRSLSGNRSTILLLAREKSDKNKIRKELDEYLATQHIASDEEYDQIICQLDSPFQHFVRVRTGSAGNRGMGIFTVTIIIVSFLFMLIPIVNMVNINLSRIYERQCEIGVRKAFGAGRGQLLLQFISENVFITALAGLLGLAGAAVMIFFINQSSPVPDEMELKINFIFFLSAVVFIMIFGLLSGVYPALRISKLQIAESLKGISL